MKKILLMAAIAITTQNANAQGILGTRGAQDFDFETNGTFRARWLQGGPLIFGDVTDPDITYHYPRKTVFSSEYDLYMHNGSKIFLDPNLEIYSGTYKSTTNLSYLKLYDGGDGSVILNSHSGEIFLQPGDPDGTVWIAKPFSATYDTEPDKLHVDGSTYSKGYAADIKKIGNGTYNVTNDDFTILANADGGNVIINLPAGGSADPSKGRMFVIKNISSSTTTYTVRVNNVDGSYVNVPNPMGSVMVQFYDPTDGYYIISHQ